ncbi:MAG: YidC/Oxa1 family membrane protein insertase [Candidatus Moranbacteria bacterium]|nr:YidC/Oxa1 family membrane protein insertase [Candidatus Moranbacteria bacterium]
MGFIFNEFVYYPIYNLLIFTYNILPWADFGVAIIVVTIVIKMLLIPVSKKQIESQKKMTELQPKIKEMQQKYKNDKEKQSRALMDLYKEHKTNPFSGCLPMIVQLVFLIAIYRVLFNISKTGLMIDGTGLYAFVKNPGQINPNFLGIIDLSSALKITSLAIKDVPHLILVALAAFSQYVQSKMMMAKKEKETPKTENSKEDFAQIMSKQMLFLGPLLTLYIGIQFPAGLALYWLVSTVFMIVQQYQLGKEIKKTA